MRAGQIIVATTSVLIFLSAFAHALVGWPQLDRALAGVDPAVVGAAGAGWHFGSVAMAVFGVLGGLSVWQARRGDRTAHWTPAVIGAGYVAFGGAALALRGGNLHFLGFVALGALLLFGSRLWNRTD